MADIPSLTNEVNRLAEAVGWWNTAIIVMMIFAALAASGLVIVQRIAFKRAEELASVTDQLSKLKDRIKEERIAEANARAATAESKAAEANRIAEEERLARAKIEERLAWRRVNPALYKHFVSELTPFAGSVVLLNPLGNGDPETEIFAEDIAKLLHDSHWQARISTGNVSVPAPRGLICRVDESTKAGRALAEVLKQLPGATIISTQMHGAVAAVTVGLKPPP